MWVSINDQSKNAFYTFSFSSALRQNPVCSVLALQIFISHFFFIFLTGLDTTKNRFIILSVAVYTLYLYLYFFNMIWKCELYLCITTSHCIVDCVPGGLFLLVIGWCGSDVLNSISKVLFKWICCFANECFFCNYKTLVLCKYVVSNMICNMYRLNFI